ncbi:ribbon-helix-helix domain-containing protein [Pelosinus sp. sgz500959]|uniref:ribbon-helix-helix domain-containing protein n=1 Tax=Pelosinus sp. sgz500959 TaxID=3242472 RepID=UPI0036711E12
MAGKVMVSYTTRIEQSLSDRLKEHSVASDISITKIINKALEDYLDKIDLKK